VETNPNTSSATQGADLFSDASAGLELRNQIETTQDPEKKNELKHQEWMRYLGSTVKATVNGHDPVRTVYPGSRYATPETARSFMVPQLAQRQGELKMMKDRPEVKASVDLYNSYMEKFRELNKVPLQSLGPYATDEEVMLAQLQMHKQEIPEEDRQKILFGLGEAMRLGKQIDPSYDINNDEDLKHIAASVGVEAGPGYFSEGDVQPEETMGAVGRVAYAGVRAAEQGFASLGNAAIELGLTAMEGMSSDPYYTDLLNAYRAETQGKPYVDQNGQLVNTAPRPQTMANAFWTLQNVRGKMTADEIRKMAVRFGDEEAILHAQKSGTIEEFSTAVSAGLGSLVSFIGTGGGALMNAGMKGVALMSVAKEGSRMALIANALRGYKGAGFVRSSLGMGIGTAMHESALYGRVDGYGKAFVNGLIMGPVFAAGGVMGKSAERMLATRKSMPAFVKNGISGFAEGLGMAPGSVFQLESSLWKFMRDPNPDHANEYMKEVLATAMTFAIFKMRTGTTPGMEAGEKMVSAERETAFRQMLKEEAQPTAQQRQAERARDARMLEEVARLRSEGKEKEALQVEMERLGLRQAKRPSQETIARLNKAKETLLRKKRGAEPELTEEQKLEEAKRRVVDFDKLTLEERRTLEIERRKGKELTPEQLEARVQELPDPLERTDFRDLPDHIQKRLIDAPDAAARKKLWFEWRAGEGERRTGERRQGRVEIAGAALSPRGVTTLRRALKSVPGAERLAESLTTAPRMFSREEQTFFREVIDKRIRELKTVELRSQLGEGAGRSEVLKRTAREIAVLQEAKRRIVRKPAIVERVKKADAVTLGAMAKIALSNLLGEKAVEGLAKPHWKEARQDAITQVEAEIRRLKNVELRGTLAATDKPGRAQKARKEIRALQEALKRLRFAEEAEVAKEAGIHEEPGLPGVGAAAGTKKLGLESLIAQAHRLEQAGERVSLGQLTEAGRRIRARGELEAQLEAMGRTPAQAGQLGPAETVMGRLQELAQRREVKARGKRAEIGMAIGEGRFHVIKGKSASVPVKELREIADAMGIPFDQVSMVHTHPSPSTVSPRDVIETVKKSVKGVKDAAPDYMVTSDAIYEMRYVGEKTKEAAEQAEAIHDRLMQSYETNTQRLSEIVAKEMALDHQEVVDAYWKRARRETMTPKEKQIVRRVDQEFEQLLEDLAGTIGVEIKKVRAEEVEAKLFPERAMEAEARRERKESDIATEAEAEAEVEPVGEVPSEAPLRAEPGTHEEMIQMATQADRVIKSFESQGWKTDIPEPREGQPKSLRLRPEWQAEPTQENVPMTRRRDIIQVLEGLPDDPVQIRIREGVGIKGERIPEGVLGWYMGLHHQIRLRYPRRIIEATHESAHAMDEVLQRRGLWRPGKTTDVPDWLFHDLMKAAETYPNLRKAYELAKDIENELPNMQPGQRQLAEMMLEQLKNHVLAEGWAEFWARWRLEDPILENEVPRLHDFMLNDLMQRPGMEGFMRQNMRARDVLTKYREQGARGRVRSFRVMSGDKPTEIEKAVRPTLWQQTKWAFEEAFLDDLAPAKRTQQRWLKATGIDKLSITMDPVRMLEAMRMTAYQQADTMVKLRTIDMFGKETGPGLEQTLLKVGREDSPEMAEFLDYLTARRVIATHEFYMGKGQKVPEMGIALQDALAVVRETMDSPNASKFQEVAEQVREWSLRILDYGVQAGSIRQKDVDNIQAAYDVYIPFKRSIEQATGEKVERSLPGRGVAERARALRRLKGTDYEIEDPIQALREQAYDVIRKAQQHMVMQSIYLMDRVMNPRLAKEGKPGLGGLAVEVPRDAEPKQILLSRIIKSMKKKAGPEQRQEAERVAAQMIDLFGGDADTALTFFFPMGFPRGHRPRVAFRPNAPESFLQEMGLTPQEIRKINAERGELMWFELDPVLYNALTTIDAPRPFLEHAPEFLRKAILVPSTGVRLGATVLSPAFVLRNLTRDPMTAAMFKQGKKSYGLVNAWADSARAAMEQIKAAKGKPTEYTQFQALGLEGASIYGTEFQRQPLTAVPGLRMFARQVKAIARFLSKPESWNRYIEFKDVKEALEKEGAPRIEAQLEAMLASKEITNNYTRAGNLARALNQLVPYFAPNLAGKRKLWRSLLGMEGKQAQANAWIRGARDLGAITGLVYLINMMQDDEWRNDLPDWQRQLYWNVKLPGTDKILKIPKPFEAGQIFGTSMEVTLDAIRMEHGDEFAKDALIAFGADQMDSVTNAWKFAVLMPFLEVMTNYSFFRKRELEPSWMQETRLSQDRYTRYTTGIAKGLGQLTGKFGLSPIEIEQLAGGYSGGMLLSIMRAIDDVAEAASNLADGKLQVPDISLGIARSFTGTPHGQGAYADAIYQWSEYLSQAAGSEKITPLQRALRPRVERVKEAISTIRRTVEDPVQADRMIYELARPLIDQLGSLKP